MKLTENARKILEKRYLKVGKHGEIETPDKMLSRVANTVAAADRLFPGFKPDPQDTDDPTKEDGYTQITGLAEQFYTMMDNLDFLPNSPTLMNAGRELGMLSACFVLPVHDSMESIFDAVKEAALIHKAGGGTGFSFSSLRPRNDIVNSTSGVSSGPVSFMQVFNSATQAVKQGGVRRGANMGILRVDHPDIIEFINCKQDSTQFQNFNISVGITDEFMEAVINEKMYRLINPRTGEIVEEFSANYVFDLICQRAWENGEPGVIFLDEINRHNPTPELGVIAATNPCLTGDTMISTTMGKIPIAELAKSRSRSADVYTMLNGKLVIRHAINIRPTSTHPREILKITTTRGTIRCTPEHLIYVQGQEFPGWVEAKYLYKGDQLVGLREQRRGTQYIGVSLSSQPTTESVMEHRLVAKYYYDFTGDLDVHHVNGDTHDNRISNLQVLPHYLHASERMMGNKYFQQDGINGRFQSKQITKDKTIRNVGSQKSGWWVQRIEADGEEIVYDMTVLDTENFIANGIVVHNCGEQPLLPYESCNLGSINLGNFVARDKTVMWSSLESTIRCAVHFLDNVIEINQYPLEQIKHVTLQNRKIGLGVMGWADMLIKIGVEYGSTQSYELAEKIMEFITIKARSAVMQLKRPVSNVTVTTIAPTGTISIIANCSSGIEPIFAHEFNRNILDGSLGPESKPGLYKTAHEISPEAHVRMQAAFQKYTDNAVSKTINFPHSATVEDVKRAFLLAWELKCKGITVYRDGSRNNQPMEIPTTSNCTEILTSLETPIVRERPEIMEGKTYKMVTGCGSLYVTINSSAGNGPFEIFTTMGKAGGCAASQNEALGRMVSMNLRAGVTIDKIIKQLAGISCHSPVGFGEKKILSCADAIARALIQHMQIDPLQVFKIHPDVVEMAKTVRENIGPLPVFSKGACKECGSQISHEGGCMVCHSCGYSECL